MRLRDNKRKKPNVLQRIYWREDNKLLVNKEDIIENKVFDVMYLGEGNMRRSDWRILNKQDIWVREMVTSTALTRGIYDEING